MQDVREGTSSRGFDIPVSEVDLLCGGRLVRRRETLFVAVNTYLFHPGERPRGAVEVGLRFDLADRNRQPLYGFGVYAELAIQAMREVDRPGEELPIPAVAIQPGGEPSGRAELMLTIALVKMDKEPEPFMCFSLADQDRTPLYSFALHWESAIRTISLAFTLTESL
jgi:hypothetical protein